jgi:hypothetical protein
MKKELTSVALKEKTETDFLILLTEEYGFREWFWFPNMSEKELLEWWKELESVDPYFMTPEPLEGWLIEMSEELAGLYSELQKSKRCITAHFHCDDDSYIKLVNGEIVHHKGYVKE